jgi:hypothetical protein
MDQKDQRGLKGLKGQNNGTFGFGFSGALFPVSLNGPFGYINMPIPNTEEKSVLLNGGPKYNSPTMNAPYYNQQSFIDLSRHKDPEPSGFNLSKFSSEQDTPDSMFSMLYVTSINRPKIGK